MELTKCLPFPSMTAAKVLASHIESLLECLTKYKEILNKENFKTPDYIPCKIAAST